MGSGIQSALWGKSWKQDGEEAGFIPSIVGKEKEIKAGVQSCSDILSVF